MSQAVRTLKRDRQTAAPRARLEYLGNGRLFQHTGRRTRSEEHHARRLRWAAVLHIIKNCIAGIIGQRKDERAIDFSSRYMQFATAPGEVVQRERDDLTGAKTVGGDEHQHRVIASANR